MENEYLLNEIEEQNKQEKKEEENIKNMIRKGFIAKVYGLLLIQLSLTFGFIVLSIEIKSLTFFLLDHFGLYIIISIIPFIILIAIVIKPQIMRKVPINYILLFIFSFSFGYTNVLFVLRFKKVNIYLSMLLTLIVLACLFTSLGFFDKWVTFAKCGLIIPITGFAHSVASSGLDYKKEGPIYGVGSNLLKLAGPVIVYGICSAVIFGSIRYLGGLL